MVIRDTQLLVNPSKRMASAPLQHALTTARAPTGRNGDDLANEQRYLGYPATGLSPVSWRSSSRESEIPDMDSLYVKK